MTETITRSCKIHGLLTIEQLATKRRKKISNGEEKIYYECRECKKIRFKQWVSRRKDPDKIRKPERGPIFKKSNDDMYSFMMDSFFSVHSKNLKQEGVENA